MVGMTYDQLLFSSPFAQVGHLRCPPEHPWFHEPSAPETNCFVFPRTAVWIEQDGRAPFVADPTSVTAHNAGTAFRRRPISSGGVRSDWFSLAPEVLREIVADYDTRAAGAPTPFPFSRSPASAEVYLAQRRIHKYLRDTPEADALYVEEAVLTLATGILGTAYADAAHSTRAATARQRMLTERTREFLASTYAANVSLAALSREVGSSAFHLCRVFKQQTGYTIHQYRTQLRLRRSLELLEQEPRDILMAALQLGFAGHSHYTRTFLRAFGVTPSRFNAM